MLHEVHPSIKSTPSALPPSPVFYAVPMILAGELNKSYVCDAIFVARPWAVDVCSGVERQSTGLKDHSAVRKFVAAAKRFTHQV
jgi:phosphoribosylanthranilate isomerase